MPLSIAAGSSAEERHSEVCFILVCARINPKGKCPFQGFIFKKLIVL